MALTTTEPGRPQTRMARYKNNTDHELELSIGTAPGAAPAVYKAAKGATVEGPYNYAELFARAGFTLEEIPARTDHVTSSDAHGTRIEDKAQGHAKDVALDTNRDARGESTTAAAENEPQYSGPSHSDVHGTRSEERQRFGPEGEAAAKEAGKRRR